jgi:hypothetical protein
MSESSPKLAPGSRTCTVVRDFSSHGGDRHAVRDDVEVISLVALLDDDRARGVRHLERGVHELLERRGV